MMRPDGGSCEYWWLVRRFVHIVMRAAVVSIKESAERNPADSASNSLDTGLPADVVERLET